MNNIPKTIHTVALLYNSKPPPPAIAASAVLPLISISAPAVTCMDVAGSIAAKPPAEPPTLFWTSTLVPAHSAYKEAPFSNKSPAPIFPCPQ